MCITIGTWNPTADHGKNHHKLWYLKPKLVQNHEIRSLGAKILKGTKIQKLIAFQSQPVEISKTVSKKALDFCCYCLSPELRIQNSPFFGH